MAKLPDDGLCSVSRKEIAHLIHNTKGCARYTINMPNVYRSKSWSFTPLHMYLTWVPNLLLRKIVMIFSPLRVPSDICVDLCFFLISEYINDLRKFKV